MKITQILPECVNYATLKLEKYTSPFTTTSGFCPTKCLDNILQTSKFTKHYNYITHYFNEASMVSLDKEGGYIVAGREALNAGSCDGL